jgi:hypothetical protein
MADKSIVYILRYDQAGLLNCLTSEQKASLFSATVQFLCRFFPMEQLDGSMYLHWPTFKRYGGHIRSLAVHWDALDKCSETIEVPLCFMKLLQDCAEWVQ